MISSIAQLIIITASISATLYICFEKWGFIEYYQLHRRKNWPQSICDFCFCFWASLIITIYLIPSISEIYYIVAPFGAASIGKTIINLARSNNR